MDFLDLWKDAAIVLTDSGGLQEETTVLGVPCLTLRENTERPITVTEGTNTVIGSDPVRLIEESTRILSGQGKQGRRPKLWDGKAAERTVAILARELAVAAACLKAA
jgi:UDP-N-acetylglucosamine 2-epimerase (non-hydrolysing)